MRELGWPHWACAALFLLACGGGDASEPEGTESTESTEATDGSPDPASEATSTDYGLSYGTVTLTEGEVKLDVEVPDEARSITLVVDPNRDDLFFGVSQVVSPSGETLLQLTEAGDFQGPFRTLPISSAGWPLAMLFPNSPDGPQLETGTYQLTIIAGRIDDAAVSGEVSAQVDVLFERFPGQSDGSLDVVFHFIENPWLTAEDAEFDDDFQTALNEMQAIYQSAGITLGSIQYLDVADSTDLSVLDTPEEHLTLWEIADQANDRAIHFFLVEQILDGDGDVTLGLSGGLPGPPSTPGLSRSGVILPLAGLKGEGEHSSVQVFAETLAHEGGHYLGLKHTTERDGQSFDPIADTPECDASNLQEDEGTLGAEDCVGLGANNLMFWTAWTSDSPGETQTILTAGQAHVLMLNPMVQ